MASLGLWTLPFCSLARISPTFCSVASLPIESRPCFPRMASQRSGPSSPSSGDHYNSEKAGASCRSPRTWHMDGNFGLHAEDAAPRSFCSSRLRTADPSTHETRGQACWSCPLPIALQPRRGADPSLNNQTARSALSPACCDFDRLALRISQHRSASSKSKPRYRLCTIVGAPDQFGIMPQGRHTGIKME